MLSCRRLITQQGRVCRLLINDKIVTVRVSTTPSTQNHITSTTVRSYASTPQQHLEFEKLQSEVRIFIHIVYHNTNNN
jgi:hypothetical protein